MRILAAEPPGAEKPPTLPPAARTLAFNVYMKEVTEWGITALHRAAQGLRCKTAVHICYGYGIKDNIDWKASLDAEWRHYEAIFPALATSRIDQVSVECAGGKVPLALLGLLKGEEVLLGAIDVASERVETPEEVAATIDEASRFVPVERLYPCTNCGMAPMDRNIRVLVDACAIACPRPLRPRHRFHSCSKMRFRATLPAALAASSDR